MKEALLFGRIREMARILQRGWEAKKATSEAVSTPLIEKLFNDAMAAGAMAGKASGPQVMAVRAPLMRLP